MCLWAAPPLLVESSHELLDPTRGLGRLGLARLLYALLQAFLYLSGCSRWRHTAYLYVQYTLPGALATDWEQPSCWHRLPPPCV
jgi:hypothetical protein